MHPIITLIWLLGGLWRIYRLARFFQIEEYLNGRYARWLAAHPERWPLRRAVYAFGIGAGIGFVLAEAPGDLLLLAVYTVAALIAVWPPPEGEVKKAFRATQRALRLLIAAFLLFGAATLAVFLLLDTLGAGLASLRFLLAAGAGLLLFMVSPAFLIGGNMLVYPVEEALRRNFRRKARRRLRDLAPVVIGITGSYGKTSTKHFLTHLLGGRYSAAATPKSYNTLMGVCLAINTALNDVRQLDYYVVEMGAYIPGEIAEICALTRPQISLVTAVGPQHLERFGSLENTARAKAEIITALPPDGVAILNADDPLVRQMAGQAPGKVILVSRAETAGASLLARNIEETLDGLEFDVCDAASGQERHFSAAVYGLHNVTNVLMAAAAAMQAGLSLGEVALRVATLEPFEHRLQRKIQPGGLVVIDDAYSANPVGAQSALRLLDLHRQGRRILITPGMIELGAVQDAENQALGVAAAEVCTDIVLVGAAQTRAVYAGVTSTDFDRERLHVFEGHGEAVAWLRANAGAGDAVLFLNDLPDTYL